LGVVVAVVVVSSVVVVVVPEELELLDESSFFAQEMMMRLKRDMRIMDKTLFIFSSIPKVKYYGLVLGEPNIYHDSGVFYKCVWILLGGCLTVKK
jgi:hypothetical protein